MIYFENDDTGNSNNLICDDCLKVVSSSSTAREMFVDYHPNKYICIPCARASVTDVNEFNQRISSVPSIGKSKFVYYLGKLAI